MNVGDRVRRIRCANPNNTKIKIGMVGTVTYVNGVSCKVTWDGYEHDEYMCNEYNDNERLELVKPGFEYLTDTQVWKIVEGHDENTKPTNPKDRAATHRLDLSLFPETARIFGALAMTEGDSKYGGYNYRAAGVRLSTYVAALGRHVGKYYDKGEWADEKTGVPHLANALACLAVLIDGHVAGNIVDDRPPKTKGDLYVWAESLSKSLHEMFPEGPERATQINNGDVNGCVPDWLTPKS